MAGNPFDQFDQELPAGENPFDQFDAAPAPRVSSGGPTTRGRGPVPKEPLAPVNTSPWAGLQSRIEGLTASTLRGIGTISENTGDWLDLNVANLSGLTPEQIKNERQLGLIFDLADAFQKSADARNYQPDTSFDQVKEAFNPNANANRARAAAEFGEPGNYQPLSMIDRAAAVGDFVKDQTIVSLPDMVASIASLPTYVLARDQEIAERRVQLDGREGLPTAGDQLAAAPGAIIESALERFATGRVLPGGGSVGGTAAGRIARETGVQAGTEMLEEGAANLSETVGTERGFSGQEFTDAALAGGLVGGPLGAGVQTAKEAVGAVRSRFAQPAPEQSTGSNPFDQFDQEAEQPAAQATAQPEPQPVQPAPVAPAPAPAAPTSPAPVQPTAPPAAPVAAAGATTPPDSQPAPVQQPAPPEPQAAQPAPAAQPPQPVAAPAAPQGNRRTVTTATGRKVDTEFQVVDLSTLQAATGDLQNRDRARATSDLQIQNIAGNLDPERLGDSAEADRGAPIVGPDNVVESGNGRVAAIRKAYESVPERAEAYRQFLQSQGYNIDGMTQPVLVRRRVTEMTPEERRAFVIEANTSATARLNAVEQAKSDADLVGDDVLQLYRGGEFGAAGNRDFVRALVGKLPQSEQAALYGPDGALSQEGIRRIQNALLARAYDDTALLSKFTEDQDNNIRSIGGAMLDVAGAWAQLRADVRAGRVKPEFDITQALVDAARRITVARDRGETVQQVLSQVDAFNPMNPLTERLIRTFYNKDLGRAAGRDKIAEALRAYAVEAQKQTTDASLFGSDLPDVTPEQILDAQLGKRVEAAPAQQTSMFGAGGRPTTQAAPEPQQPAPAQTTGEDLEARAKALEPRVTALSQEDAKAALLAIGEKPRVNRDPRDQLMAQHPDDIEAALKAIEKPAPSKKDQVRVWKTETGTYVDGDTSGKIEYIHGENADGEFAGIVRLYDQSGKLVREVKLGVQSYFDSVGFHERVFGEDSEAEITIDGKQQAAEDRAPMEDTLNDRRPASRADDQADTQGAAEDEADLLAELDEEPQQSQRGRNATPEIMRVSFTDRRSWAEQAFADAGVDPDVATLWPIEQQFSVLAKLVKDRFGITVQKTGTLQGRYAVDQMLDLYRNLQFMAFTMGMPANAFGLRGKLNLVLRKGMQYFGAYYPTAARVEGVTFPAGTIVLPKRSNSFAHEWMHALDHYLMQLFPEPNSFALLSQQVRGKGVDYAAGSAKEAFVRVMNHLFYDQASLAAKVLALELQLENPNLSATARKKAEDQLESLKRGNARTKSVAPSDFRRSSANFDPGNADYWANPQEMLARAFEAYTAFKVERAGGTTEAIAKGDMAYLSNADKRLAETFPKGDERFRIFAAFDELFMLMAREQLIADGQPAAVPGNTSQFDPNVWHRTPPTRPEYRGLAGAIRQTLDEMRQAAAKIRREDARPDNPKSLGQQIQDVSKVAVSVEMETFRIFERRYPNSKAIRILADLLVPMPGSDRYVDRVFEDAAEMHYKANINRLASIIERYQLEGLNDAETRVLRDLLISEFVPNAPENIRKAATEIRRLLDMEWYANQQAGLEIGYTKNGFLPRLLDMAMVTSDRAGFVSAASKVYEIIFDKEFGADVAEVMERGKNFSGVVKFLRQARKSGIKVKPIMKVLRRIRKMEAQMKTSEDPDILQGNIEQATEELHELLSDIYDQVRSDKARFDAEAWHTAIMTADTNDFDAMSPTARYTKSRTLPPEADKLMEDYYINDPIEAIQTYFSQSARRTEYAKRFGPKGEKVKPLFEQMTAEGVAADDQAYMVDMLSRLTGRARTNLPPTYAKFLSGVQALGIVTLLPRAVWSAVGEPVMTASRTGDIRNAFLPHVNMIKSIVGTADSKDWAEISRAIGLVTNSMADTLAANRFGGNYGDSIKTQRMMAQFGKRSLLHGITNASRIAILPLQHEYLHGLARRIIENRDAANSAALMREVGIKDPVAFSNWILESDRMPTVEELFDSNGIETKFGYEWITAMNRISEQTIQSPKAYNRPMMANNPHGRLIYGILSFSMTFYENVWKRSARQLAGMSQRTGKASAAKYAALNMLPAFAALFVAQTLMSTLREAIFNPERWEEWEKEGVLVERLLQLGFTRSFAFGLADVPIQAFTGLKYQRDLSNMFVGAVPSYFLQATQGLMTPLINNSDKTNNAEYKAAQSAYQLFAAPLIARALSLAPGGKLIDPLYGVGMQYFTSPASRDAVTDMVVGEKDSRVKARERAEKKEATGRATGRETGRETGRKTGRETGRDTGG